jgi:SAM-dependent methyltransferase
MSSKCNVCGDSFKKPIFVSTDNLSITTMNELVPGKVQVHFCHGCGHLQTNELPNLKEYYAHDYEINLASDDDDQIYDIVNGKPAFRADHQASVLASKVSLFPGCRILDYGCAKALTLRKLSKKHPEIQPLLFDVTDKYIPFWKRFPVKPEWATHDPSSIWEGTIDVILSFYALEHIADLEETLGNIKVLLKRDGILYFIVPNVYENIADFIVADHINHFSSSSLRFMLTHAGFSNIDIDASVHHAAFVIKAQFSSESSESFDEVSVTSLAKNLETAQSMADYWHNIRRSIRQFEENLNPDDVCAIYGAGFYGNFVASALSNINRIVCFVDQNPHLHGTEIQGKRIVGPDEMPQDVTHCLVGLNPRNASSCIQAIESWNRRKLKYFYL